MKNEHQLIILSENIIFGTKTYSMYTRSKEKEAKQQKSEVDNNESRDSEAEQASSKSKTGTSEKARRQEKNKYKVQHADVTSTTLSDEESLTHHLKSPESRSYLLFKPGDSWLDNQVCCRWI